MLPSKISALLQPPTLTAGLYLVATPIGALADITLRALAVLQAVDGIVCEDTRHSQKLLRAFDIHKPLQPYHDFSNEQQRNAIVQRLKRGERLALISDAGMPLIADPGYKLVRDCVEHSIPVFSIPGANAALAGLICSGLPTDQFCFMGFLPTKTVARQNFLQQCLHYPMPLLFYEAPHRLLETLQDVAQVMGNRHVFVGRELTKLYEEKISLPVEQVIKHYQSHPLKGEIVLIIEGAAAPVSSSDEVDALLTKALLQGQSLKEASAAVAAATGKPRKEVYSRALDLKNEGRLDAS